MRKSLFFLFLIAGLAVQTQAQPLSPGDIAFVGMNSDDPDEFAFVALTELPAGTVISFTDNGWLAAGGFRSGEGTFTWTATASVPAGTVVNPGTVTGPLFSTSGDQIIAYQGDAATPTLLYALNNEGAAVWQDDATSTNTSDLPTGLVNGETAVALNEFDNQVYVGITTGTRADLLAALGDPANWSGDDANRQTMPTADFTVTDAGGGGGGGAQDGNGSATLANVGGDLSGTDLFFRNQSAQSLAVTLTGVSAGPLAQAAMTVPSGWTGLSLAGVALSGSGFTGASATVSGQTVTVTGAALTNTDTGTLTLTGLTTPETIGLSNDGTYTFTVETATDGGTLTDILTSPVAYVTIPISNIRDVDANGEPVDAGNRVAVEGVATVGSGTFDADNLLAYLQDETGGVALFAGSLNPTITEGNRYAVKGSVTGFNGLTEVVPATLADVVDLGTDTPVTALSTTIADLLTDPEDFEGQFVALTNVTKVSGTWPAEGSSADITITDDGGSTTLNLRIDADTDVDGSPEPTYPITLVGILGQFDSTQPRTEGYQVQPRSTADLNAPPPPTTTQVRFASNTLSFSEAGGSLALTVNIINASATTATTVEVALTGGTATNGDDLSTFSTQTLTFPAGSSDPQTVLVTVLDDEADEPDETLVFALQNVSGGDSATLGTPASFTLTLLDDDTADVVEDGDGTVTVVNSDTGPLQGTTVFRRNLPQTFSFEVAGVEGGTLTQLRLTLPDGWTGLGAGTAALTGTGFASATPVVEGQSVTITGASLTHLATGTVILTSITPVVPDDPAEDGGATILAQTALDGGTLTDIASPPAAFITTPISHFRDTDASGLALDLNNTVAVEGVATVGSVTFDGDNLLAYLQDETGGMVLFNSILNPLITAGNRYVVKGTLLQFNGLTRLQPATLTDVASLGADTPVVADTTTLAALLADAEAFEGKLVTLTNVTKVDGTWPPLNTEASLTLTDDGGTSTLTLHIDPDTNVDGSTEPTYPTTITGVVGQADATLPFTAGYELLPRSAADLVNSIPPPPPDTTVVQFALSGGTAAEDSGTATVTVTLTDPSATTATAVQVLVVGGTATAGDDYTFSTQTLTFPAGSSTSRSVTLTLVDDLMAEDDETVVLALATPTGGTAARVGGLGSFTLTLTDDDSGGNVLPMGEAHLLPDGTSVTVEGIVTRALGAFTRIQDETGGLVMRQTAGAFFDAVASGTVRKGDRLRATGVLSQFNALKQLNEADITAFEVLSRDNPLPAVQMVTLAELAANGESYESELVRTTGLTIETSDLAFAAARTYTLSDASLAGGIVSLRLPNAGDSDVDGLSIIAGPYTFEGVLGQFSSTDPATGYQLMAVEAGDLTSTVATEDETLPTAFTLHGNYPNPFNPATTLRFDLPVPAEVSVVLYDVQGRQVMALPVQRLDAGHNRTITVVASSLPSGLYLYRLTAQLPTRTHVATGRMVLVK
jgi:DNA/RNA endonuclease YhcR with UshA esterase domain/P pilus assembly chaperone PapD